MKKSTQQTQKVETAKAFKCHKCWKCFTALQDLIGHHARIYNRVYCGVCHKKCNCYTDYCTSLAKQMHRGQDDNFACADCVLACTGTCLDEHKQTHRGPDGNFACAECGNRYSNFKHLSEHSLLHNSPTVLKELSADRNLREVIEYHRRDLKYPINMKSSPTEYEINEKVPDPTQKEYPGEK